MISKFFKPIPERVGFATIAGSRDKHDILDQK